VLSEHPYLYCEHEPVNSVDPSGHEPSWWDKLKLGLLWLWDTTFGRIRTPPEIPPQPRIRVIPPVPPYHRLEPPGDLPGNGRYPSPGPPGGGGNGPGRLPGSGGGLGAIVTIGIGAGIAAQGIRAVVRYRRNIEEAYAMLEEDIGR